MSMSRYCTLLTGKCRVNSRLMTMHMHAAVGYLTMAGRQHWYRSRHGHGRTTELRQNNSPVLMECLLECPRAANINVCKYNVLESYDHALLARVFTS